MNNAASDSDAEVGVFVSAQGDTDGLFPEFVTFEAWTGSHDPIYYEVVLGDAVVKTGCEDYRVDVAFEFDPEEDYHFTFSAWTAESKVASLKWRHLGKSWAALYRFRPTVDALAGTYVLSALRLTWYDGREEDLLAQGAQLALTLNPDGTTSGHLFDPVGELFVGAMGDDPDADLTGTWKISNDWVTLDHDAPTYLRQVAFVAKGKGLSSRATFGSMTIRISLRRRE